ncbi:hypothetical protein ElyMa_006956500 [Elysia marginata]|uniref:Lipocalin/cytosolic fatty-acid binding domain-containing protein n=1 Tax=Elysia marginata TaxID=1093978 RepID=A0AAV4JPZ0_9GAST|nr:hypothetical protein ElyMa_006956500 [Elysia marginata]
MAWAMGTWRIDMTRSEKLVEQSLASGYPKEVCTDELLGQLRVNISADGDVVVSKTEFPGMPAKETRYKFGEQFEMDTAKGKVKV